jgi:polyisoprenoid-binding protein YceI
VLNKLTFCDAYRETAREHIHSIQTESNETQRPVPRSLGAMQRPFSVVRVAQRLAMTLALLGVSAGYASAAGATQWNVDPTHSSAEFTTIHFGLSHIIGTIPIKTATVATRPDSLVPVSIEATLDVTGIDTKVAMRDADLKSANFFDVAKYPTMTFKSRSIAERGTNRFAVTGDLTFHGVTHPITLDVKALGRGKGLKDVPFVSYIATTTIDRTQWGMSFDAPLAVGTSVYITLNIEADGT